MVELKILVMPSKDWLLRLILAITIAVSILSAPSADATTLRVEALAGALVQPTSVYLHKVTGFGLYLPLFDEAGFIQASLVARPEHQSAGYGSSDQLWSVVMGAAVPFSTGRFHSGLGLGSAAGYVRPLAPQPSSQALPASRYQQSTVNVALGYSLTVLGFISLGLRHETAVGIGDKRQRAAFVSWPFQVYSFAAGVSL